MMNHVEQEQVLPLAKQALADSPVYLQHIGNLMSGCVREMRAGRDRQALSAFARGAADLNEFIKLFEQIATAAHSTQANQTSAFKASLFDTLKEMDQSLRSQDFVGLSDQIEAQLLGLLPAWPKVAEELSAGLDAQAS